MHIDPQKYLPGGWLVLNEDGAIKFAPHFFAEALEIEDEISIYELFDADRDPHLNFHRFHVRPGGVVEYHIAVERALADPLGFRYWQDERANEDKLIRFYVVDDTSVHQFEEWRFRKLRQYVINDVQSVVVSEFKNRLSAIRALSDVIRDNPNAAPESAGRLLSLVGELEEVVMNIDAEFSDVEPEMLVDDLPVRVHDLAPTIASWGNGSVGVSLDFDDDAGETMVVASAVERILLPVVQNAVEAMPKSGEVGVRANRLGQRFVAFEVSDDGRGMEGHELARAEDPFFTTKHGHVGLGLSRARENLYAMGGYWNFKSSSDGTTVRICIPSLRIDDAFV